MDWQDFYQTYKLPLRRFISYFIGDYGAAEDLVQETFIKAKRAYQSLKDEKAVKNWLYAIARNCCLDYLRQHKQKQEQIPLPEDLASHLSVTLKIEQKEMSQCVQNFIKTLPEPDRSLLLLKDIEGFSFQEVATIVKMPVGAAKVATTRAREKLKQVLNEHCEFFYDERSVLRCSQKSNGLTDASNCRGC